MSEELITKYNINIRDGVHKIKLTFMDEKGAVHVGYTEIGGNIHGLGNLDVESLCEDYAHTLLTDFHQLEDISEVEDLEPEEREKFMYQFKHPITGEVTDFLTEDDCLEDELKDLLVAVEIVDYQKSQPLRDGEKRNMVIGG